MDVYVVLEEEEMGEEMVESVQDFWDKEEVGLWERVIFVVSVMG